MDKIHELESPSKDNILNSFRVSNNKDMSAANQIMMSNSYESHMSPNGPLEVVGSDG